METHKEKKLIRYDDLTITLSKIGITLKEIAKLDR